VSFVEKALKKIQANGRAQQPAQPPVVFGRVVAPDEERRAPRLEPARAAKPVRHSGKTVHVDRDALRRAGLLPPESQERELADQYRAIKRPLIEAAFGESSEPVAQLIMTASALPGDGKTFTCINLAFSMSIEKDYTVVLVDGDVAKPHISTAFGVDREPGLLDVLADPTLDIESVIIPTDVPRLSLLPAGRRSETATELLASGRMAAVAQQLATLSRNVIVLFDSPPVLLTSEARVLMNLAGQIVLVVKAGVTPQQAVKDAIETIGPGKNIRLVLNQAELSGPLGYFYGYRYGYQWSHEQQADAGASNS
jgi:exopolysaccharide/PEP-CTERM locus tyrosine autokinase